MMSQIPSHPRCLESEFQTSISIKHRCFRILRRQSRGNDDKTINTSTRSRDVTWRHSRIIQHCLRDIYPFLVYWPIPHNIWYCLPRPSCALNREPYSQQQCILPIIRSNFHCPVSFSSCRVGDLTAPSILTRCAAAWHLMGGGVGGGGAPYSILGRLPTNCPAYVQRRYMEIAHSGENTNGRNGTSAEQPTGFLSVLMKMSWTIRKHESIVYATCGQNKYQS